MNKLRIAMITKSMLVGYGIDEVVNIISKKLSDQRYEVTVFTSKYEFPHGNYDVKLYSLLPLPFVNEFWQNHFLPDFRSSVSLSKSLRDYDIIVTYDPMHLIGVLAKIWLQKPVIMYYFGVTPYFVLDSAIRKIESLRQKTFWNFSFLIGDYLMVNSSYTKHLLPSHLRGKSIVNYHGIEHLLCTKNQEAARFRKDLEIGNKQLILSVGRFSTPYKGMADLVKIFTKFQQKSQNAVLLLVGRGSTKDLDIQASMRDLILMPDVSYDVLKMCFAACDIYCTCSRWEGFNLAAVAAQANGKPVIAYDVGAHSEVVENQKTGFLVKNSTEFIQALLLLVDNSETRRRFSEKAKIVAKKYTWEKSIKKFEDIIQAVCTTYFG